MLPSISSIMQHKCKLKVTILLKIQLFLVKGKHPIIQFYSLLIAIEVRDQLTILTLSETYRTIYYEAINSMVGSIKDRFKQPSSEVYKHLESLVLKSISSINASKEIAYLKGTLKDDVDYLQFEVECDVLRVMFNEGQLQHFKDVYTRLKEIIHNSP